jgi:hypothetical protein
MQQYSREKIIGTQRVNKYVSNAQCNASEVKSQVSTTKYVNHHSMLSDISTPKLQQTEAGTTTI